MRLPAAPAGVGTCEVDGDGAGQLSTALDVVQKRVLHADLTALQDDLPGVPVRRAFPCL